MIGAAIAVYTVLVVALYYRETRDSSKLKKQKKPIKIRVKRADY